MKRDPVEETEEYRHVASQAEREAEELLRRRSVTPQMLGYCHAFWPEKKRILKERYGIEWKTPAEINPDILFD